MESVGLNLNTALLTGVIALLGYALMVSRNLDKSMAAVNLLLLGYNKTGGLLIDIAHIKEMVNTIETKVNTLVQTSNNLNDRVSAIESALRAEDKRQDREIDNMRKEVMSLAEALRRHFNNSTTPNQRP